MKRGRLVMGVPSALRDASFVTRPKEAAPQDEESSSSLRSRSEKRAAPQDEETSSS
jgi:hypothetical protein